MQVYLITLFMGDVKQSTTHFFFDIPVGSRRFSRYYYFKELDTDRLRLNLSFWVSAVRSLAKSMNK